MGLGLPDSIPWCAPDTECSGLFADDGARVACVAIAWPDPDWWEQWVRNADAAGEPELITVAFPFDQGERDKFPTTQLDLLETEDPNLGEAEWAELLDWLELQRLVFHNAKYDLSMFRAGTRHWSGRDLEQALEWDTMVAQREFDPMEAAGLDAAATRRGFGGKRGLDAVKEWLRKHKYPTNRYDLVPWSIIKAYVTTDAEQTALLRIDQLARARAGEIDDAALNRVDRELRKLRVLYHMEWRGVGYDAARSLRGAELLERRADEIEKSLTFPATPAGAKRYFVDELGLTVDRVSDKTGKPSIDEEQVRKWIGEGVPLAREYALVTKARRAVSMWYRGYPEKMGADGRLRTSFKQTHVKTGRMSVERVQLQAMPKKDKRKAVGAKEELPIFVDVPDVRELLQPRPGNGLWSLDLSQAELRVASKYAHCQRMLDRLLDPDADVHGDTCQQVLGVSRDDPDFKYKRDIAKRTNFAAIFQVGAKKLQATLARQADIHLSEQECHRIVGRWRAAYPEFGYLYGQSERFAKAHGYVPLLPRTPYTVRSWFGPRDWHHTAWNRIVQGPKAYGTMVPTPDGWRAAETIRPGDTVYGRKGETRVRATRDAGVQTVYRVTGHDGRHLDVAAGHLWTVYRNRNDRVGGLYPSKTITTEELVYEVRSGRYCNLPFYEPDEGPTVDLPVDPYMVGVWLGDGHRTGSVRYTAIATNVDDFSHLVDRLGPAGVRPGKGRKMNLVWQRDAYDRRTLQELDMNLYRTASRVQRLMLLQGLMDTDGCALRANAQFSNVDKVKADLVVELTRSLGGYAYVSRHENRWRGFWRVRCYLPDGACPFSLPRKVDRWRPMARRWLRVVAVEELPLAVPTVCYEVEAKDGLYCAGDYVVTHNSLAEAFGMLMVEVESRWPGFLVLTIHDSLVLDIPADEGDQVCDEIATAGGDMMSNLFDIEMSMDKDRYA